MSFDLRRAIWRRRDDRRVYEEQYRPLLDRAYALTRGKLSIPQIEIKWAAINLRCTLSAHAQVRVFGEVIGGEQRNDPARIARLLDEAIMKYEKETG